MFRVLVVSHFLMNEASNIFENPQLIWLTQDGKFTYPS